MYAAARAEHAADPEREPRHPWRWDRSRAWWVPAGDWAGDHGIVVMKRGRDPKWYARAKRVGVVAATDTADQAKVALEGWVAMMSDDFDKRVEQRRELSRFCGKPPASPGTTLLDALRSGCWFRRRAWRDQGNHRQYQLRGNVLWSRDSDRQDLIDGDVAGKHVPFGLAEILADDWETVG